MSSGAERLTKDLLITVETYSKNKIHTKCVKKRGNNDFYVIRIKMIYLQKRLIHGNLCHVAMKKVISYCKQNILLKKKSKNTKEKRINGLMIMKVCMIVKILIKNSFVALIKAR